LRLERGGALATMNLLVFEENTKGISEKREKERVRKTGDRERKRERKRNNWKKKNEKGKKKEREKLGEGRQRRTTNQ
jgi:hypothetical protein